MITHTFQLMPGVGPWREKDLWARGILSWGQVPARGCVMSPRLDDRFRAQLDRARDALARRDLAGLAQLIPVREHWRLYPEFAQSAAFFDIEAESEGPTVASVFDARGLHTFIRGRNLEALPEALMASPLWVTFNGSVFDVPVLARHFGAFPTPAAHIDLRFLCRRLRLSGGLKGIEDALGIGRPPHLKGVRGLDAVLLWRAYQQTGEVEALRFLVEYNLYDAFQLRTVLERCFNQAARALGFHDPPIPVFDRGDVLYDTSRLLLDLSPTASDTDLLERLRATCACAS